MIKKSNTLTAGGGLGAAGGASTRATLLSGAGGSWKALRGTRAWDSTGVGGAEPCWFLPFFPLNKPFSYFCASLMQLCNDQEY